MSLNRRRLLQAGALGASAGFLSPGLVARAVRRAVTGCDAEPVRLAFFGPGGRGWGNLSALAAQDVEVAALCDVDRNRSQRARERFPEAPFYTDYRELLAERGDRLDGVVVSTPDHMHAPIAVPAMRMGLHCYCEKPMTWSIEEARTMRTIAREKGLATQMGNQGTASSGLRAGAALLRSGRLGAVRELHVWTNRPIWPQGVASPTDTPPVPEHLDWDLWLGCADERPYHPAYLPFSWRGWYDFGTGALGDMACHTMNMPFLGLLPGPPARLSAEVSERMDDSFPTGSRVVYEYPGRDGRPAFTMTWYDGTMSPPQGLLGEEELPGSGSLVVGERGALYSRGDNGTSFEVRAEEGAVIETPEEGFERSPGHHAEWLAAIRGEGRALSAFDHSGLLTETVLLGVLAQRSERPFRWNDDEMAATGAPELDPLVRRPYRTGYSIHA